ncbi:hypothetical protein HD554DRAFT_2037329 [Boletus coccyginus]|nr:hypothetical protein HD554DRAFT_2037329 [Boletus coccyginus]
MALFPEDHMSPLTVAIVHVTASPGSTALTFNLRATLSLTVRRGCLVRLDPIWLSVSHVTRTHARIDRKRRRSVTKPDGHKSAPSTAKRTRNDPVKLDTECCSIIHDRYRSPGKIKNTTNFVRLKIPVIRIRLCMTIEALLPTTQSLTEDIGGAHRRICGITEISGSGLSSLGRVGWKLPSSVATEAQDSGNSARCNSAFTRKRNGTHNGRGESEWLPQDRTTGVGPRSLDARQTRGGYVGHEESKTEPEDMVAGANDSECQEASLLSRWSTRPSLATTYKPPSIQTLSSMIPRLLHAVVAPARNSMRGEELSFGFRTWSVNKKNVHDV